MMVIGLSMFSQPTQAPARADDQRPARAHAAHGVLDGARARIAAAVEQQISCPPGPPGKWPPG